MNDFIIKLFNNLNYANIKYAILRNYEDLPEKDHTTEYFDLDLIVASRDYKRFYDLLINISSKHHLNIAKKINREYVKTTQIYKIENDGFINAIQIDVHIKGQNWHGYYYMQEKEILKDRFLYKNFYVVSKFHQNLFNWLDKLLWGNYVKKKYKDDILNVLNQDISKLEIFLSNILGKELTKIITKIIKEKNLEKSLYIRKNIIKKLRKYSLLKFPFLSIKSIFLFFYFELLLRISPPGLCVVFPKSKEVLSKELFNKFKILLVNSQNIIPYNGTNKFQWLIFYLIKVFPTVRKSGLVFVITENKKAILKDKILFADNVNNELLNELIKSYKKAHIPFLANVLIED